MTRFFLRAKIFLMRQVVPAFQPIRLLLESSIMCRHRRRRRHRCRRRRRCPDDDDGRWAAASRQIFHTADGLLLLYFASGFCFTFVRFLDLSEETKKVKKEVSNVLRFFGGVGRSPIFFSEPSHVTRICYVAAVVSKEDFF